MRAVWCALQLGRMLLGRQQRAQFAWSGAPSEPDWGRAEPDARAEDAGAEPDARQGKNKSHSRKRECPSGVSLRADAMRAGRRTSVLSSRTWSASPPLRAGRAKEMRFGTPGWDPKKKTVPSHGSTLVGVSKEGAFKLLETIKNEKIRCTSTSGCATPASTRPKVCRRRMSCPRSGTSTSTSAAATRPTQASQEVGALKKLGRVLVPARHSR